MNVERKGNVNKYWVPALPPWRGRRRNCGRKKHYSRIKIDNVVYSKHIHMHILSQSMLATMANTAKRGRECGIWLFKTTMRISVDFLGFFFSQLQRVWHSTWSKSHKGISCFSSCLQGLALNCCPESFHDQRWRGSVRETNPVLPTLLWVVVPQHSNRDLPEAETGTRSRGFCWNRTDYLLGENCRRTSVRGSMRGCGNLEDNPERSEDNGGLAYKISEGRFKVLKILSGPFMWYFQLIATEVKLLIYQDNHDWSSGVEDWSVIKKKPTPLTIFSQRLFFVRVHHAETVVEMGPP